jgi:predicted signal transduction protein with EAL and GGDEF domain
MLEPDGTQCIVDAIISLAHRLGLKTVAEGVEDHEQLELLRAAGCDLIQGFLFSHPLKADDASSLIFQQTKFETGAPVLATPTLGEKVAAGRSERMTTLPIRKRR